jgi:putative copper export protein
VGLAVLISATAAWFLVFRRRPPGLLPVLLLAWIAAAAGAVAVTVAAAEAADTSIGTFVSSPTGGAFVRQGISVVICGAVVAFAVRRPSARLVAVVGAAAAVALLFHTLGGHAGAERAGRWLAVGTQWIHVIAAGVWTGGLLWLLLGAPRLDTGRRASAIRGFSRLAGVALLLVVATGVVRSIDLLGGFGELGELFTSDWGTTLAIKLAVVLVLISIGAWNRFRRLPSLGSGRDVLRAVAFEVVLAAGVFGVTGVLAGLPPPADARAVAVSPAPQVVVDGQDFATSVRVRLTIAPGLPGANRFTADIVDFDSGRPVTARRVTLRVALTSRPDLDPVVVVLRRDASAWTASSTALSIAGTWEGAMTIEGTDGSVRVPLKITIEAAPQRVSVTPGTGDLPDLTTIELGDGRSVQAYLDPEEPGDSQVHLTAFDAAGQELPLAGASISATAPAGGREELDITRLSPGHFVAPVRLAPGVWTFGFEANARTGSPFTTTFEQEVAG